MSSIRKIEIEEKEEKPLETCQTKQVPAFTLKRKISIDIDVEMSPKMSKIGEKKVACSASCGVCKKKLKFISTYQCRCGNNYCGKHRFFDQHSCTFDYKTEAKKILEQNNPKVRAKKLL
ncbi:hypothetical protein NUSPORA_00248 [Nucleospora cyclopteri]